MKKRTAYILGGALVLVGIGAILAVRHEGDIRFYAYSISRSGDESFAEHKQSLRQAFRQVAEEPKSVDAHLALGRAQVAIGDYGPAERHFYKAPKLDPTRIAPVRGLVDLYISTEEYKKAEALAQLEIQKFGTAESYNDLIRLYSQHMEGMEGEVTDLYEQAFEKTGDPQFLMSLANRAAQAGEYRAAVSYLDRWLANASNQTNRELVESLRREYRRQY